MKNEIGEKIICLRKGVGVTSGKNIKLIRINLGLTMQQFGELLNPVASKSIVSRWESGVSLPNAKRLKQIADIAGVKASDLINR